MAISPQKISSGSSYFFTSLLFILKQLSCVFFLTVAYRCIPQQQKSPTFFVYEPTYRLSETVIGHGEYKISGSVQRESSVLENWKRPNARQAVRLCFSKSNQELFHANRRFSFKGRSLKPIASQIQKSVGPADFGPIFFEENNNEFASALFRLTRLNIENELILRNQKIFNNVIRQNPNVYIDMLVSETLINFYEATIHHEPMNDYDTEGLAHQFIWGENRSQYHDPEEGVYDPEANYLFSDRLETLNSSASAAWRQLILSTNPGDIVLYKSDLLFIERAINSQLDPICLKERVLRFIENPTDNQMIIEAKLEHDYKDEIPLPDNDSSQNQKGEYIDMLLARFGSSNSLINGKIDLDYYELNSLLHSVGLHVDLDKDTDKMLISISCESLTKNQILMGDIFRVYPLEGESGSDSDSDNAMYHYGINDILVKLNIPRGHPRYDWVFRPNYYLKDSLSEFLLEVESDDANCIVNDWRFYDSEAKLVPNNTRIPLFWKNSFSSTVNEFVDRYVLSCSYPKNFQKLFAEIVQQGLLKSDFGCSLDVNNYGCNKTLTFENSCALRVACHLAMAHQTYFKLLEDLENKFPLMGKSLGNPLRYVVPNTQKMAQISDFDSPQYMKIDRLNPVGFEYRDSDADHPYPYKKPV